MQLPESKLTKRQRKEFRADYMDGDRPGVIVAEVRFDDQCGNGHNTFAITAEIFEPPYQRGEPSKIHDPSGIKCWLSACGCCHDDIAKHFPELAPLIKWHLVSSVGPMHYLANATYLAGNRDYNGRAAGE